MPRPPCCASDDSREHRRRAFPLSDCHPARRHPSPRPTRRPAPLSQRAAEHCAGRHSPRYGTLAGGVLTAKYIDGSRWSKAAAADRPLSECRMRFKPDFQVGRTPRLPTHNQPPPFAAAWPDPCPSSPTLHPRPLLTPSASLCARSLGTACQWRCWPPRHTRSSRRSTA